MEIFDEQGYKWYGKSVESFPETKIQDTGQGKLKIIRSFDIKKALGDARTGKQIYKEIENFIKTTLFDSGLTTDDNYPPKITEKDDLIRIIVVAMPSKFRANIYEGMKHGEEGISSVKGLKIRAAKSDNINKTLNGEPTGGN